jgi:PKD repeat protein
MRIVLILIINLLFSRSSHSQCMANFMFSISGNTVDFISQSTTSQGSIVGYSWNFGDPTSGVNNVSTLQYPIHIFTYPGTYSVTHTISTNLGCQDTYSMMIIIQPPYYQIFLCPPTASTVLSSNSSGSNYYWQLSIDGNNFTNLANAGNYAGVLTHQLQLNNIPSSFTGFYYRCITDGNPGIPYKISFINSWTGSQNNLWSNPVNWSCGVLPDAYTAVYLNTGSVLVDINTTVYSLSVGGAGIVTVQPGVSLTVLH